MFNISLHEAQKVIKNYPTKKLFVAAKVKEFMAPGISVDVPTAKIAKYWNECKEMVDENNQKTVTT